MSHFRKMIVLWIRRAIFTKLRERASPPPEHKEGYPRIPGTRKDLANVPTYVGVHATTNTFRTKKGDTTTPITPHLNRSLESIIVG